MNSTLTKGLIVVAVALLAVPAALAQTTGRIDGIVLDDEGAPLPGVTVTVNSPGLQGERIQVTGADGRFRFLALPPGEYSLQAGLEGFTPLEQTGIRVQLDRAASLQLTMASGFGEEVTVSGAAPIIDSTSTTSGANFGEQLFEELPARQFQSLAFLAPGVVDGGIAGNPSIGGASVAENRYVIDGLDVTDPAYGTVGDPFFSGSSLGGVPEEFIKEVEVKTGGYEAEYGGALGGFLNVITKSGGNELEGDLFAYFSDDSLQGEAPPVPQTGRETGFEEIDVGAALGGKFIQDKLWYFVAVDAAETDTAVFTRGDTIGDTETVETLFYSGKLTWQLNPSHQVVASAFGNPVDSNDTILNAYGRLGTTDESGSNNYGVTYNATISSSNFLEIGAGRFQEDIVSLPYADNPRYDARQTGSRVQDFVAQQGCGDITPFFDPFSIFNFTTGCVGATFMSPDGVDRSRDELRANWTWFGGTGNLDHEVKLGGHIREVELDSFESYPGRDLSPFVDDDGVMVDPSGLTGQRWLLFNDFALLLEFENHSVGSTDEEAIFLQDKVRIGDYFTLNLGVRADSFESRGGGFESATGPFIDVSNDPLRGLDFSFSDMVAPRVGFTWDVAQNGRSKLYGHFGQFYESVPLDINVRAFGTEIFNFFYFFYPEDGSIPTASHPGTWFYSYPLGVGTLRSADIEPMYTEEILGGFEYEVLPNVAVGVKYTERTINNVIEDISVDGGHTYFITNPGGEVSVNPVTGEVLPESVFFPEPTRDYEALELTLNKRFTNNWQLYASGVYSKNEGNYGGLFRQDNGQLDPNITSLYDLPSLLEGAFGLLPNDREYQFKAYGSYVWPFRLTSGFFLQYLDGTPVSKLGAHPVYGANERFVTDRGTGGRTPDVWFLDLHLQYPIRFANGVELELIADIFNLTDEDEATRLDQTWTNASRDAAGNPLPGLANDCGGPGTGPGTSCEAGNPLWGTPIAYQTPQTIRLGARLRF